VSFSSKVDSSSDDSVGVRVLSHDTTRVLRDLEADPRLLAVTKQGRIVAVLIPTSLPAMFKRWLSLSPGREDAVRGLQRDGAPDLDRLASENHDGEDLDHPIVSVGIKEFAAATSEYLRRAEEGQWVFLRRHSRPVAVLVRFSLPELMRITIESEGGDPLTVTDPTEAARQHLDIETTESLA
jgi:antitoxin (DNA-binding transcriptional repressor) of toxin-antitoxin stability system